MKISTVSVKCPTCQKEVLMIPSAEHRPFCSHRCQLIDLGEWASENYKMPASDQDEDWSEDASQYE